MGGSSSAAPDRGAQWDVPTKRTVLVILFVCAVGVLWVSRGVIPWLIVSGIFAYLLNPLVDLAERLRIPRSVSTIALFILVFIAIIITPLLLVPILLAQLASLSFDVPSTAVRLLYWASNTFTNLPDTVQVIGYDVDVSGLTTQIEQAYQDFRFIPTLAEVLAYIQQLISTATNVVSSTAAIGVSVVGGIVQILFTLLIVFFLSLYLTKDAPRIRAYFQGLLPTSYQPEFVDLLRRMSIIWTSFLRGQFILSVVIFLVTWGVLVLIGMPGALILSIVAGALEIVPNLGPILAMIPAVIVALIQGSSVLDIPNFGFALITVGVYFIIQQLENNLLVPRVIGRGVNLHPIVVICGVTVGYSMAGVLGALLAAPIMATLRVLGSYIHAKLLDYPPFLGQELPPLRPRRSYVYRRTVRGEELTAERAATREHGSRPAVEATSPPPASAPSAEADEASDPSKSDNLGATPRMA